jgi:cytochrome c1
LPNDVAALVQWIARTEHTKPGVLMPQFGMLPKEELQAMAVYLKGLK